LIFDCLLMAQLLRRLIKMRDYCSDTLGLHSVINSSRVSCACWILLCLCWTIRTFQLITQFSKSGMILRNLFIYSLVDQRATWKKNCSPSIHKGLSPMCMWDCRFWWDVDTFPQRGHFKNVRLHMVPWFRGGF